MQVAETHKDQNLSLDKKTDKSTIGGALTSGFQDNRPEAMQMHKLKDSMGNSPLKEQTAQMQAIADKSVSKKNNNTGLPDNLKSAGSKSSPTIQLKEIIKGERTFPKKGTLAINFEERYMGSAIGMYGTVSFEPLKGGKLADKIDLIQIASMTSNHAGQQIQNQQLPAITPSNHQAAGAGEQAQSKQLPAAASNEQVAATRAGQRKPLFSLVALKPQIVSSGSGQPKLIAPKDDSKQNGHSPPAAAAASNPQTAASGAGQSEKEFDTDGNSKVKDMWRVNDKFHIDLLGSASIPRSKSNDKVIEPGYNSERRHKENSKERMDSVTVSKSGKQLDQQNVYDNRQPTADTETRIIAQGPGYNKGNDQIQKTELMDFPYSPDPCVASFHTTADADGFAWGTVKWGFRSVKPPGGELKIESVDQPEFVVGQTNEMAAARRMFNEIMANSGAWTSPEIFDYTIKLLNSGDQSNKDKGVKVLKGIARAMERVIRKIVSVTAEKSTRTQFLTPHINRLKEVIALFKRYLPNAVTTIEELERLEKDAKTELEKP